MEIFGTVAAAIGLAAKVKLVFDTFEKVGYNKSDAIGLCSDIQTSLSRIDGYLKQSSTVHSDGLSQDISEFERELKRILGHQELLTKQSTDGLWDRSTTKLKELYNAGDIKHSLAQLCQEIQTCEQNLQRSCAIRTDCGVSTVLQNQETMQRQIQMLVDALLPTSNPMRMSTLERIEENIQDHISEIETDGVLGQELDRIRTRNGSQAALSIKTAKFSLRSFSSSVIEKDYLRRSIKELASTLPALSEQATKRINLTWFRDPFKRLVVWEVDTIPNRSKQDSIRETLRILAIIRSKERILYIDAARDLLSLSRALGDLGMEKEAGVMCDWGVQICQEFAGSDNPRMLFNLANFLHKLFLDLRCRGLTDDAEKVFAKAVEARTQLGKLDQVDYLPELTSSLHKLGFSVYSAGRYEDAVKIQEEVVTVRQELVEGNRDTYLPYLASSLHNLGTFVYKAGRHEDAVTLLQQTITMRRELMERYRDGHLPPLAVSLHNLGSFAQREGRYEDAAKLQQEAVTMRRELVERNRDTYLPDLASSLHNLGSSVFSVGRYEVAVELQQEAVTIRRELVEKNRDMYLPPLSSSLYNLGSSMHSAGRYGDAMRLQQEAVMMGRELVERSRDTYLPDLASSLHNLGVSMYSEGQYEDAVKVQQEAVTIRRELVERDRKAYAANLALSLGRLAVFLRSAKRSEEAVVIQEEADSIREESGQNV